MVRRISKPSGSRGGGVYGGVSGEYLGEEERTGEYVGVGVRRGEPCPLACAAAAEDSPSPCSPCTLAVYPWNEQ